MSNRKVSQADQVLSYLKMKKTINATEAFGLYGIQRLAAIVHRLKKRGHNIRSIDRQGVRGRYTEYMLGA